MKPDFASASGRLAIFEQLVRGEHGGGWKARANLRPSQTKLDRLEEAAIHAPDNTIDAAIEMLERADYRRGNQRYWSFKRKLRLWPRKGSWTLSLHMGLFSLHRHFKDEDNE